jgi:hypothetical protein
MAFSAEVLQEFSIGKSLITDEGVLNLYVDGEFDTATTDAELRNKLSGPGVRVAIAENLVGSYDPDGTSTDDTGTTVSGLTSTQDFFDSLTAIFENYATPEDDEEIEIEEEILTPGQIEQKVLNFLKACLI